MWYNFKIMFELVKIVEHLTCLVNELYSLQYTIKKKCVEVYIILIYGVSTGVLRFVQDKTSV